MTYKALKNKKKKETEYFWLATILILIFIVAISLLLVSSAKAEDLRPLAGKVTEILDGDTIKLEVTVRLDEIDCPEKAQNGGSKSIEWMRDNLRGEKVFLVGMKREFYGRILAHVRKRGQDVGEKLVKDGLCWQYKASRDEELKRLQEEARAKKIGIWSSASVQAPWDYRKRLKEESKKARESIPVDDDELENSEPTFVPPPNIPVLKVKPGTLRDLGKARWTALPMNPSPTGTVIIEEDEESSE